VEKDGPKNVPDANNAKMEQSYSDAVDAEKTALAINPNLAWSH
jgi:hypothetical protein